MNQNKKPNTCAALSWKTLTVLAVPPLAVQVLLQISLQSLVLNSALAQSSEFQSQSLRQLPMPAPAAASSPLHPHHSAVKVAEIGEIRKAGEVKEIREVSNALKDGHPSAQGKTAKIVKKWKPDPNKPWRPAARSTAAANAVALAAPHVITQIAAPHVITQIAAPHASNQIIAPHVTPISKTNHRPATGSPANATTNKVLQAHSQPALQQSSPANSAQAGSAQSSGQASGQATGQSSSQASGQASSAHTGSGQASSGQASSGQPNSGQTNPAQIAPGQANGQASSAPANSPPTAAAKPAIKKVAAKKKCFIRTITENSKPTSVSKAAKEADHKVQAHDLAGAVNVWSTELEARPHNADSWVGRAGVKRLIGDFHGASDDLDHAIELNPNHVAALISRAAVRRRLADMRGAAKDIDKAVDLAPRNFQAYSERSSLRFALNDMQGAMADYNYAITLYPEMNKQASKYTYGPATNPIVANSAPAGQSNASVPGSQTKASEINERHDKNESKIGDRNHEKANDKFSEKSHDKSKHTHENLPHYTAAELAKLNNAAVQDINTKHFANAIKAFERLLRISPDYAHARENLVIAHNNFGLELAMRKPTDALKQFRAALFIDPSQVAIRKNLLAIMQESGLDPANPDDHITAADQCMANGDPEGAYVELSEALKSKNSPQLRDKMQQALAAIDKGNARRASEDLENADLTNSSQQNLDLPPPTILGALLPAIMEEPQAATPSTPNPTTARPASVQTSPAVTTQATTATDSAPSTMTTIAALPNAIIRTRPETVTLRAVQPSEAFKPAIYESPSAMPTYDATFVKSTLDNAPETILQVARQLASEDRELDAEALLHRLCDMLRKKTIKGDRSAEALLENTLETLSDLYMKHGRYQNAEPSLRELLSLREKSKGQDDPILGRTLAHYAAVLKALGRTEEATKMELRANLILNQQ